MFVNLIPTKIGKRQFLQKMVLTTLTLVILGLVGAQTIQAKTRLGKYYGGIEIGSKGVKAIVLEIYSSPEEYDIDIKMDDTINTSVISGTPEAISETADAVKTFYVRMVEQYKVPEDNIFIAGSSGVRESFSGEKLPKLDDLSSKVEQRTGKRVEYLAVESEVKHGINGLIPGQFTDRSFLVDVGSGNLKCGYQESKSPQGLNIERFIVITGFPGTKTFTDKVKEEKGNFLQKAEELQTTLIENSLREQLERKPGFQNRSRVYLTGGIAWALSTLLYPENNKGYVSLKPHDFQQFHERVTTNLDTPNRIFEVDLSKIKDPQKREKAQKQIEKVANTFTAEQLVGGATLLKGLSREFKFGNKKIYFARYGYLAWIFSYINTKALN